jgi:hypothetical protein
MSDPEIGMLLAYLSATADRKMDTASNYLSPDVTLVFPQGQFDSLNQMAEAMAGRYLSIGKTHDTWDISGAEERTVVVTTGTLHGVNLHGVDFAGVRFCDRFVIRSGLITEQHVWNDLAESGVLDLR